MNKILLLGLMFLVMIVSVNATEYTINTTDIISYYNFSTDAKDYFGKHNGTVTGATLSSSVPVYNLTGNGTPKSYYFDGNDKILMADSPDWDFGSVTLSAWVKLTASNTGRRRIVNQYNYNTGGAFWWISVNNNYAEVGFNTGSGTSVIQADNTVETPRETMTQVEKESREIIKQNAENLKLLYK